MSSSDYPDFERESTNHMTNYDATSAASGCRIPVAYIAAAGSWVRSLALQTPFANVRRLADGPSASLNLNDAELIQTNPGGLSERLKRAHGELVGLAIGISEYSPGTKLSRLAACVNDATRVREAFLDIPQLNADSLRLWSLTDKTVEKPTRQHDRPIEAPCKSCDRRRPALFTTAVMRSRSTMNCIWSPATLTPRTMQMHCSQ